MAPMQGPTWADRTFSAINCSRLVMLGLWDVISFHTLCWEIGDKNRSWSKLYIWILHVLYVRVNVWDMFAGGPGDREKALGLTVSSLCDREVNSVADIQIGQSLNRFCVQSYVHSVPSLCPPLSSLLISSVVCSPTRELPYFSFILHPSRRRH